MRAVIQIVLDMSIPAFKISCVSEAHNEVVIAIDNREYFFNATGASMSLSGEAEASLVAIVAMKSNAPMVLDRPVSSVFLKGLQHIGAIFRQWYGFAPLQDVIAPLAARVEVKRGSRVGSFFSGGADSFFTLLKHLDEITDLILVIGMDIPLSDVKQSEVTEAAAREVAAAFGKNLVVIRTNIRASTERAGLDWGTQAHGAVLATVGHLLADDFKLIYIASSHTYQGLFPWGSHPVVDHHWSSEHLKFVHDGCDATRVEKIKLISENPAALSALRVCWMSSGGVYNCCVCSKCVRTMISLAAVGALDQATSFPRKLELALVKKLKLHKANDTLFALENIEALEVSGARPEILGALKVALRRSRFRAGLTALIGLFPKLDRMLKIGHSFLKPSPPGQEMVAAAFEMPPKG